MIAYNSNASQVIGIIKDDLLNLMSTEKKDKLLRRVASTVTAVMHKRVHTDGLDANENPIGTYSKSYMAVRTGEYQNSEKFSKGKNKGKVKNAGVYTKYGVNVGGRRYFVNISDKGIARKKYNRNSDPKVILSLSRQMEIDLAVCEQNPIKTSYGYAIGYQNDFNYQKLIWNEEKYKKKILTVLSKKEEMVIDEIVKSELENDRRSN